MAYFPTSEGYYDYANNRYIYQYKDHLGNVRSSYARNPDTGSAEVLDRNDYYPFGMNMQGYSSAFDSAGGVYNYKYNQKELQETGFYDYGWRQYMPDLGRWFGMDKLSETYTSTSPYAYVMNNPISHLDPDGRYADNWLQDMWDKTNSSSTWSNNGDGTFSGGETKGSDPGKGIFQSIGAFFGNIFNGIFGNSARRDAQITTVLPGAEVTKVQKILWVGELSFMNESEWDRAGADWSNVPTMGPIPESQGKTDMQMMVAEHPLVQGAVLGAATGGVANWVASAYRGTVVLGEVTEGSYSVYQGLDAANNVRYVGITGRDTALRFAEHVAAGGEKSLLRFEAIQGGLTKTGARVMEQGLINEYGMVKNGGVLLNKINSIAPKNWWTYGVTPP